MNKTAIKNFAIWARNKLIADVCYRAGLVGITEKGIQDALPQSDNTTEFYDIGIATPYAVSGQAAIRQRRNLAEAIRRRAADSDYPTAYRCIMEEVAYTWFNRLIAVRFMEVNDYLPGRVRVLSSESGKIEPDLVTNPFDAGLSFTAEEEQAILQLKQDNKLDELFRLLFIKQCNALAAVLPALFEQTEDYTELLLNLSVVDQEGVVWHLTHDIPEDDFNVEKGGQVEIIGWLYQYYNTEINEQIYDGNMSKTRIPKELLSAATTIYTPDWPVRYMVENSLGRLWLEHCTPGMACGNGEDALRELWMYYIDEAEQEPEVDKELKELQRQYHFDDPTQIKLIDPCVGSGHILVYAFEVLFQIYYSRGYAERDIPALILKHNLYGLDIDCRAFQLAYFALMMKARQYDRRFLTRGIQPHVYWAAGDTELSEVGSLFIVANWEEPSAEQLSLYDMADNYKRLLAQKYDVVITNPPYLGSSRFSPALDKYAKENYADEKPDLCMAMYKQALQRLCKPNGFVAFITTSSWMFLSSFEKVRKHLQSSAYISSLVDFGTELFDGKVGHNPIVAWITRKTKIDYNMTAVRLVDYCYSRRNEKESEFFNSKNRYTAQQDNFSKIPGSPIAYWVSDSFFNDFVRGTSIGNISIISEGIKTGNNDLFLRLWYEINSCGFSFSLSNCGYKWYPHHKGGEYRKWYGNLDWVINWENDGHAIRSSENSGLQGKSIYFKSFSSWSKISSKGNPFRLYEKNCLFDSGAPAISNECLYYTTALFNTKVGAYFLTVLSPTLNLQVGNVKNVPLIMEQKEYVEQLVYNNIVLSRADWDSFETSWDFKEHPLYTSARWAGRNGEWITVQQAFEDWQGVAEGRFNQLKANEEELNRIFIDIYGLQDELTPEVEDKDVTVRRADLSRDIRSLLSYAVGCMFGRYSLDMPGLAYAGGEWDAGKYSSFQPDADNIIPLTDEAYLEDDIVSRLCQWLSVVYGTNTLEENLDFIAKALGNKGSTSREVIRNYFLKDFFADHCKIYQKRPIYWLFDSGKQNGFKALVYLHRYTPDTIGKLRVDYLHRLQRVYASEIERMQDMIDNSKNQREVTVSTKRKEKLQKQLKECREYDEKIAHLALARIELDLDDGVRVNYRKVQTATDDKFYEVLADSKNIMGKK